MILVLAFAFFPHHLRAQDAQDRFKTQLLPIIEHVMEQRGIPGFAIAVVHNQKVVYAAGFGVRNLQNKNDKITPLNVEAYPESSNVYDSLGEAYMLNGEKAPAIENYEKSLKLNPNNANAVEKLKLLMSGVSPALGADLKGRFEAYRQAMNSHDLQTVLACLAADYEFKVANSNYKVAKKDIVGHLEWDFAMNARSAYGDIQIKGNTISTVITEQNDFYKAIGVSERKFGFTFVYDDKGLIKEAILEKSLSSSEAFDAAFKPALEWARKERPGELAEIYPNDNFVYNTQMAKRWSQLLSDWHKATR
jgi:tetratricopeptide (TPR) repeat protein